MGAMSGSKTSGPMPLRSQHPNPVSSIDCTRTGPQDAPSASCWPLRSRPSSRQSPLAVPTWSYARLADSQTDRHDCRVWPVSQQDPASIFPGARHPTAGVEDTVRTADRRAVLLLRDQPAVELGLEVAARGGRQVGLAKASSGTDWPPGRIRPCLSVSTEAARRSEPGLGRERGGGARRLERSRAVAFPGDLGREAADGRPDSLHGVARPLYSPSGRTISRCEAEAT